MLSINGDRVGRQMGIQRLSVIRKVTFMGRVSRKRTLRELIN